MSKPLFATTWQKVLTPKTLAYWQYWQLFGNGLSNNNSHLICHIIAKLFYKIIYSIIHLYKFALRIYKSTILNFTK